MAKFSIGDKVRIKRGASFTSEKRNGEVATISDRDYSETIKANYYSFEEFPSSGVWEGELELVERAKTVNTEEFLGLGKFASDRDSAVVETEEFVKPDAINPAHYQGFSNGAQVVDITEHLSFCAGNAIKYLARAGKKDPAKHVEDLEKAAWFVQREIQRVKAGKPRD